MSTSQLSSPQLERYTLSLSADWFGGTNEQNSASIEAYRVGSLASSTVIGEHEAFDSNGNSIETDPKEVLEDYLFHPHPDSYFHETFWLIEQEMLQLNDFVVMTLFHAYVTRRNLQRQLEKVSSDASVGAEVFHVLDDELSRWQDTCVLSVWASSFMLVSAFYERILKMLCDELGQGRAPGNPPRGISKIEHFLNFLSDAYGINFNNSEAEATEKEARLLRNAFAHGNIEKCRKLLDKVELRDFMESISERLDIIEAAVLDSERADEVMSDP